MPELPEVETIKLGLQRKIIGLKIQKIQVLSPKSFLGNPSLAEGQIVLKVWRKAKILGVDLTGHSGAKRSEAISEACELSLLKSRSYRSAGASLQDDNKITLLFHLKMSGQLVWKGESGKGEGERFIGGHPTEDMLGKMPNSHTRVIFTLQQESRVKNLESRKTKSRLSTLATSHLYFNDQRKFGWVKVIESGKGKVLSDKSLKNLGPEPLEKDFTWQMLKQNLLKHKKTPVKVAIMDQTVVSGVGNIYANEACFNAKLDPRIKVGELSDTQFKALHKGIIAALKAGIKHGGSTRVHFVDPEGHKGYFLDYAFVYWRDKHLCKVCGAQIKKISLGGRGTYFCPSCQK